MKKIKRNWVLAIGLLCGMFVSGAALAHSIIYFTAGKTPTTAEKAEIAKLNAAAAAQYTVRVQNAAKTTARNGAAPSYVAGAVPPIYRDGGIDSGTSLYTIVNPNLLPVAPNLPSIEARVYHGQVITTAGGGTLSVSVVGNVVRAATRVAPDAGS
jgi:hypothetical protein